MTLNLHIRDVPDDVHRRLVERAANAGMSLRQYTIHVLQDHCAVPTTDEWLDSLRDLAVAEGRVSGAQAVAEARDADDEAAGGGDSAGR